MIWKKEHLIKKENDGIEEIENVYGETVEFYDLSALSQIGNKKIVLNKFADMVKDLDGIILDIGAGTGKTTIEMANMICDKEIIALEPSAYMRTAFMARLMEHNEVKERISLLPIDVGKYSFRDKIKWCNVHGSTWTFKKG